MINDDILIKVVRSRGHLRDWPDEVVKMKTRMYNMRLGFPGIRNDHLSLIEFKDIKVGEMFIYDPYIELGDGVGDEAPMMLRVLPENKCYIEGIGCGLDSRRDPYRLKFRWQDTVDMPPLDPHFLIQRVEVRPDLNGGPGYYYFFKSYRDFRE